LSDKPEWSKEFTKRNIIDRLDLSIQELSELGKGWLLTSIIILYIRGYFNSLLIDQSLNLQGFDYMLIEIFVWGFIYFTHELSHKFSAIKFGARAEYRLSKEGIILAIASVIIGFPMLAVGAVFWWGETTSSIGIRGRVSAAGPISNIILIGFSYIVIAISSMVILTVPELGLYLLRAGTFGILYNTLLGIFNLLPIGVLDGQKVLDWDGRIWLVLMGSFVIIGIFGGGLSFFLKVFLIT
jgi:Zn-dependent protease